MKTFKDIREMVSGQRGLDYEMKIYKAIKDAGLDFFTPGSKPAAGFSNQGAGDIEAKLYRKDFNIEVKLSADDQMGGGSFRYDYTTKQFQSVKPIDPSDLELLQAAAVDKIPAIDAYIQAARKLEPVQYHKNISGLPITVSKEGRDKLKTSGFLQAINTKVITNTAFIEKHYNKKGVYYIQIGGAGLFYLGKDILDLKVPRLQGSIQIELRLAYAGGGSKFLDGTENRSAGLRFQGRLKAKNKSPYTIDTVEGIYKLLLEK